MQYPAFWKDFTVIFAAMDKTSFALLVVLPYMVLMAWWLYQRSLLRHLRALKDLLAEDSPLPVLSCALRMGFVFAAFLPDTFILTYWYADDGGNKTKAFTPDQNVFCVPFIMMTCNFVIFLMVSSLYIIEQKFSLIGEEMKNMLSKNNPYGNPDTRKPDSLQQVQQIRIKVVHLRQIHKDLCRISAVPLVLNNVMKLNGFVFMLFYMLTYSSEGQEFASIILSCLGNLSVLFLLGYVTDAAQGKVRVFVQR